MPQKRKPLGVTRGHGSASARRGSVSPLVAVSLVGLVGFVALAVDVGVMYAAKAELQRAADAAALAAAAELGVGTGNPIERARQAGMNYAAMNTVLNEPPILDSSDFVFGQAYIDQLTNRYVFIPDAPFSNAVRVRVRRTQGSPSGPIPTFFSAIFGRSSVDISASSAAVLTPRDIVFVLDVSASHNDDSELRSFRRTDVPIRGVWAHLWDTNLAPQPLQDGLPAGPSFGNMRTWGTNTVDPSWDFAADPGLVRIPKGGASGLTAAWISQTLSEKGFGTYTAAEASVIATGPRGETTTAYRRRVRVALGLDRWKSGKPGGQPGGNGDNVIDASEVVSMVPYPSTTAGAAASFSKRVGGSWDAYVNYVTSTSSSMNVYNPDHYVYGDPGLRYRYGLKTFVDFLQSNQCGDSRSPGLAGSPEQPMRAVVDAVLASLDLIEELQSNDLVGLAAYDKYGYGPADKPANLSWLTDDLNSIRTKVGLLQAGMWRSTTNTAQGIDKGVDVLFDSPRQRSNAAKVIILLTDGRPNQTRANPTQYYDEWLDYDHSPPKQDAVNAARDAAAQGVRIYTVSVGATCDLALMADIAAIGKGATFHAEGDVSTYREQLQEILRDLGGRRPVALIQ